jgi:hypothetical protein
MQFVIEFRSVVLCSYCGWTDKNSGGTAVTYFRVVFRILHVWMDERRERPHGVGADSVLKQTQLSKI